jgi:epoxyqueuosine reductase
MSIDPVKEVKKLLTEQTDLAFDIIPLNTPLSFSNYTDWLDQGLNADMKYMSDGFAIRENPKKEFKKMKSIIVFEQSYYPIKNNTETLFESLRIAHYARNKDYHIWFRQNLNNLINRLEEKFPDETFQAFTDAVPLLERDYGAQAALGWIGKNTCLIHPKKGSLFFIGEILTSIESFSKPTPLHDFCGSCTACMDHCPTQAITHDRVLDANKCISYWNIESKGVPPKEIRKSMGDWFFGCDICQTVCPWNIKIHKLQKDFVDSRPHRLNEEEELRFILTSSNKKLLKLLKETPLSRAGGRGLKRNALLVIGNAKLINLKPEVEYYLKHAQLGELAQWTLDQFL